MYTIKSSLLPNTLERTGKNMEDDLYTEHSTRVCKSYLVTLGVNVTDVTMLNYYMYFIYIEDAIAAAGRLYSGYSTLGQTML